MRSLFILLLLFAVPARGAPVDVTYTLTALGMNVLEITARLDVSDRGYRVEAHSQTTGAAALFVRGGQTTISEGQWRGAEAVPLRYRADGVWRGEQRRTHLDFEGSRPVLRSLLPVMEPEREAVPPARLTGAMDTLSALIWMARLAGLGDRCDGRTMTFDGRRLQEWTARTEGRQELVAVGGAYRAPALRCAITTQLIAGFRSDESRETTGRVIPGTVWLGLVSPHLPPIPLRVDMETRMFGTVRVDLVRVTNPP
ncbi:DUF3108 domain-containing protein [Plastoroseomonas arctica]|uniref:DUF3108 domain-containing protein n=1 Tax=Plastoroseomonas arctica TaxID=1509237 RepID=A0AAF1JUS7_9PROT|nr:DUF3108 domain-containing protein [Plastoroseomonas arctica]MBR0653929.1 DUF3108 domain-containing protein [Plastoroseomonas arctica]